MGKWDPRARGWRWEGKLIAELFKVSKKFLDRSDSYAGVVSGVYFTAVSEAFPSSNYQA